MNKAGATNLLQLSTSSVLKLSLQGYQKTERLCLIIETSTDMEPSSLFHRPVEVPGAEDFTNENFRTLDRSLEIHNVTSKLKSRMLSSEFFYSNPEITCTQTQDPNNNLNFGFTAVIVVNQTTLFQTVSENKDNTKKNRTDFFSRSKSPLKPFICYFEAYQTQIHPTEQPSSYPVN